MALFLVDTWYCDDVWLQSQQQRSEWERCLLGYPFISSLSCAHTCAPQLYFQATSVLIMESLTLMAFDLCDFYVISFYYLRSERRSCAFLSVACAFKNKRRKHHHDSTKNCVCVLMCVHACARVCICAFSLQNFTSSEVTFITYFLNLSLHWRRNLRCRCSCDWILFCLKPEHKKCYK